MSGYSPVTADTAVRAYVLGEPDPSGYDPIMDRPIYSARPICERDMCAHEALPGHSWCLRKDCGIIPPWEEVTGDRE